MGGARRALGNAGAGMMPLVVAHRDASGLLNGCWEFDPVRGVVVLVVRVNDAAATVAVDVSVCSPERARHGAYPIRRYSGDMWRIWPAQYIYGPSCDLLMEPCPIVEALGILPVVLSHSPEAISIELAAL